MATSSTIPKPDSLKLAKTEQACIDFIDSAIDHGKNFPVPLSSVQSFVALYATSDLLLHIGGHETCVENFIISRKHVWKTSEVGGNVVVESQSPEFRDVLISISEYIQGRSERVGGAKVQDVSSFLGGKFAWFRRRFGRGMQSFEGVKNFLLEFPILFEMVDFGAKKSHLENVLFKTKITVADGVILLDESLKFAQLSTHPTAGRFGGTATEFRSGDRLEGIGRILHYVPDGFYGFIRDDQSLQQAYFSLSSVQPDTIGTTELKQMTSKGQKFKFEAVVSKEYMAGTAKNKWRVVRMRPCDDQGLVLQVATATTKQESIISEMASNSANWDVSSDATVDEAFDSEVSSNRRRMSKALAMGQKSDFDESSSSDFAASDNFHSEDVKAKMPLDDYWDIDHLMEEPTRPPLVCCVFEKPDCDPSPMLSGLTTGIAGYWDQRYIRDQESCGAKHIRAKMEPSCKIVDDYSRISADNSTKTKNPVPTRPVNSASALNFHPIRPTDVQNSRKVEKCDAQCQTDFRDEREILLRILRQCPDLLKLVKAIKQVNEF